MSYSLWEKVLGHENVKKDLATLIEKSRIPSTMIFTGPNGVGKKRLALAFAQALVCSKSVLACGECDDCLRIFKEQSENLLFIKPEGTQIKMTQAKAVIEFFALANMSQARIVIIDDAEKLNTQAANALLKILEEPPENSFIILVTSSIAGVLPTIRSRSQITRFSGLKHDDLAKISYAPAWALAAAQGRADILQQVSSEEFQQTRTRALDLLFEILKMKPNPELREQLVELFKDKEDSFQILRIWQQALRDLSLINSEGASLIHRDHRDSYQEYSHFPTWIFDEYYQEVTELEKFFLANFDRSLAIENFYYKNTQKRLV